MGRLASFAAKQAQLGETVEIINCEKAIITGNKYTTFDDHKVKLKRGSKSTGPFTNRTADRFVKRAIRGMLNYKRENGMKSFKRIKCYIGVPESFKDKKPEALKKMDITKLSILKYTTVKDVCKIIGGKL